MVEASRQAPVERGTGNISGSGPGRDSEKTGIFETDPQALASGCESDKVSENFQSGVQGVRAITSIWSRKTLWLMFALLYLVSFVDMLLTSVQEALNPYITSSFGRHGLLGVVSILSTVLSGCTTLTLSKIIDIWGRVEGFVSMLLIVMIGLIMKATCQTMETYLGAHVLYWTGHIGLMYVIDVMLADMTTLKNRMVMFGINGTPTIASTFAGPAVADLFYTNLNFRWAFGAFAIILIGVCLPTLLVMILMHRKAVNEGLATSTKSNRSWWQSVVHYTNELDIVGIILVTAVFVLILLPFNIVAFASRGWETPYIIAMEVVGVICIPLFYLWELKFAAVQFLPWKYLKEPTIVGSCLLYAIMFCSTFAWNGYLSSYLQVVHRLDITSAGYVLNAYTLSSAIFAPLIGFVISFTGDFKWSAYVGVPLMLLGTALLIPFRAPDTHVGLLTMTQILIGIGSGLFATCGQLAVMVPVTHQEIAVVMAIWGMFGSFGAAIGSAIAGGIWNNLLPHELYNRLPEGVKDQSPIIFGDIVVQMGYADGTPERDAVVGAYAAVQRKMVIAGTAFMPLCLLSIFIWKNVNLKKLQRERGIQTKGNVW